MKRLRGRTAAFRVVFFNTFHPVVPLWESTFSQLEQRNVEPFAVIGDRDYRDGGDGGVKQERLVRLSALWIRPKTKFGKHLSYSIGALWGLLFFKASGVVFLTQPPLFFVLGGLLCRLRKIPYVVHVMDFYPEVLLKLGVMNDGLLGKVLLRLASNAYRKSDGVISLGPCSSKLLSNHGVPKERIYEVSNWPIEGIEPLSSLRNSFADTHGLTDKFVVLYSGNMGKGHLHEAIAATARRMADLKQLVFVFIGGGSEMERLKRAIGELDNCVFLPFQPVEKLCESLSSSSVHFISLKDSCCGVMVPSKLYGCLASGRPVIFEGPEDSTISRTIDKAGCGVRVAPGDIDALEVALLNLMEDEGLRIQWGQRARLYYEAHCTPEVSSARYGDALMSIFQGQATAAGKEN